MAPRGGSGHLGKGVSDSLAVHLVGLDFCNAGQVTVLARIGDILDDNTIDFHLEHHPIAVAAQSSLLGAFPEYPASFARIDMIEEVLLINQLVTASLVGDVPRLRFCLLGSVFRHF